MIRFSLKTPRRAAPGFADAGFARVRRDVKNRQGDPNLGAMRRPRRGVQRRGTNRVRNIGGHIGPSSSSPGECEHSSAGFAAASLRFAHSGDNAVPMGLLAAMAFADQSRLISRLCTAKTMEGQSLGRAERSRCAQRPRSGRLDGEHGSGTPSCVHTVAPRGELAPRRRALNSARRRR
jgi:hypothetical protein